MRDTVTAWHRPVTLPSVTVSVDAERREDEVDDAWVRRIRLHRPEYQRLTQAAARLAVGDDIPTGVINDLAAVCEALVGAEDGGILDGRATLLDALDTGERRQIRSAIEDLRTACIQAPGRA